jgi:metal-sulfur cluster biosynthetic enzyme
MTTAAEVREALKQVLDPELGYNVVDLGLVYDVDVEGTLVRVLLTTTTKGCPATEFIRDAVEQRAGAVPGVTKVDVVMTWDPPWNPDKMSDEAKEHFGFVTESAAGGRW